MGLETVTDIDDLVITNPTSSDPKSQGDDQIRNLKIAVKNAFAGFTGSVLVTGTDGGSANTYTVTPTNAVPAYASRMIVIFSPTADNTGAATINISGLGAKSIKTVSGAALVSGDLVAGTIYAAAYNGTDFRLLSVTKDYVDDVREYATQLAFSSALPAQILGLLISDGASASFSKTFTGFAVNTVRATVASHATTADIWGAAGNEIDFTGTATVTNFPAAPVAGASRILHCAGACTFTNNANISVQGAANYTAEAGDIVTVRAITTSTFRVTVEKANGRSVASPGSMVLLSTVSASAASTVDIETGFGSTYDDYVILASGVRTSTALTNITAKLKIGGAYISAGYDGIFIYDNSAAPGRASQVTANGSSAVVAFGASATGDGVTNFEVDVFDANSAIGKGCSFEGVGNSIATTALYPFNGGFGCRTAGVLSGVRLAPAAGTITGTFRLYGIRKS